MGDSLKSIFKANGEVALAQAIDPPTARDGEVPYGIYVRPAGVIHPHH